MAYNNKELYLSHARWQYSAYQSHSGNQANGVVWLSLKSQLEGRGCQSTTNIRCFQPHETEKIYNNCFITCYTTHLSHFLLVSKLLMIRNQRADLLPWWYVIKNPGVYLYLSFPTQPLELCVVVNQSTPQVYDCHY